MDKYKVEVENTSDGPVFWVRKNGNRWVRQELKKDVEDLLTIMVLSTAAGTPIDIEDDVDNSNLMVTFDAHKQRVLLVEK